MIHRTRLRPIAARCLSVQPILFLGLLIGCCPVNFAAAQQAYPMLMSIEPVAAQVGESSLHTIESRYSSEGTYRIIVSGDGVVGEVVPPESADAKPTPQSLQVRFNVADDALPGVRDVRVATPNGVSTIAQLVIAGDPIVVETADNDEFDSATPFAVPATLCGSLEKAEDVDWFKFSARGGERLYLTVRCMKLQDRIHDLQRHADPILTIRQANGATIATSDNVFGADPFLCHTFDEDGEYYLEIRDVRYQGNKFWQYAIEVSHQPYATAVFPLAFTPETTEANVAPLIAGPMGEMPVDRGKVTIPPASLTLPEAVSIGIRTARLRYDGGGEQAVAVVIADGPFEFESDTGNDTPETAQEVQLPAGIHGRIERPRDVDCFAFTAERGERFDFEVFASRVGSPLDSHLRLLDAEGKPLQLNDDLRDGKRVYADSRIENWSAPADGRYVLEIRDLNLRGGEGFVYFLQATTARPHFKLYSDTDKTLLTPGTSGVIFVRAERKHGFKGEIGLEVSGLPPGVTAESGRILAGAHTDGCIVLSAADSAVPDVSNIEIRGVSEPEGEQGGDVITAVATNYQEIYQPGGGRGHWPVEAHAVSVGTPADILAVRVTPNEVRLKPGESVTLEVELERAAGFDKNVLLEVVYKHLNSVFGDPLPKGVTVDSAASTTLLTGGASRGKITLSASDDAVLTEHQTFSVMANVSINFVMKATYASSPVAIAVLP